MSMTFGQKIKELRVAQGWGQEHLANKMGMDRANISNYERDVVKNVPADVLMKFADLFKVSADYLLGKSEIKDSIDTETEFIEKLELSDDRLLRNVTLTLDGEELTKDEAMHIIAYLRTVRQLKQS
ncbi:helix-turn-helix domain-containing protein [Paenibacillus aurantiacus]|uniref:Helix-turn-helix domain-containing protein n=1 Tax=Paenibacillus aurantiacus TaxID=1936118 RepID=A0ABV5L175_9BACL